MAINVLGKNILKLTKTANAESRGTRSRGSSSEVGALGGAVASPVDPGAGDAGIVGESDDREQGKN